MNRGSARWFWMVLALALGMTVAEAKDRVTASELAEWQAFYAVEPFGDVRADLRSAIVAHTMGSAFSDSDTNLTLDDFMPEFGGGSLARPVAPGSNSEPATGSEEEFTRFADAMCSTPRNKPAPGSREETMEFLAAMGAVKKEES